MQDSIHIFHNDQRNRTTQPGQNDMITTKENALPPKGDTYTDALPLSQAPTPSGNGLKQFPTAKDAFTPIVDPLPWYRDREYFLGGWLSATVWKSAVRQKPPILPQEPTNTTTS